MLGFLWGMIGIVSAMQEPGAAVTSAPELLPKVSGPPQGARWLTPPTPREADYRANPRLGDRSRRVVVRCRIVASGVPDRCAVVRPTPRRGDIDQSAVAVVGRARLDPATILPTDIGQTFDVTVVM